MTQIKSKVEYSSNNSGGSWWLKDKDWEALENAGWEVEWGGVYFCHYKHNRSKTKPEYLKTFCENPDKCPGHRVFESYKDAVAGGKSGRWLGALATKATRYGLNLRDAAAEWEIVTGQCSTDPGCACCGQPHHFTEYDENGNYIDSGPTIETRGTW